MNLGFVGVGKWAAKLNDAFRAEGGCAYGYDRQTPERIHVPGPKEFYDVFGAFYMPWREQIASRDIDALVVCAPPDITTEVALACAAAGKPVMATKPLMLTVPIPIRAPFYVDFWRLWDETYQIIRAGVQKDKAHATSFYCKFYGSGPIRTFPGLLDYGPHAVAFARDLFMADEFDTVKLRARATRAGGELLEFELWEENQAGNPIECVVHVGNGATEGAREFVVNVDDGGRIFWWETPTHTCYGLDPFVARHRVLKDEALRRMCRSFMHDISEGFVTTAHLDLSCAVMRDLARVRALADAKEPK